MPMKRPWEMKMMEGRFRREEMGEANIEAKITVKDIEVVEEGTIRDTEVITAGRVVEGTEDKGRGVVAAAGNIEDPAID